MRARPTATMVIGAVTVVVSLFIILSGQLQGWSTIMGFIPLRFSTSVPLDALPVWVTPLSATLVHAGFLHLVMNMILLLWCGRQVEAVIGPGSLAFLYVVGAYAAAAGQYLLEPMSVLPMIGASGAVSAIIGAFAVSFSRPKAIVRSLRLNRWLNVIWLMVAWIVLQWMMAWLMGLQGVLLAAGAHVGGFVAGVALQKPLLLWRYRKA